MTDWKEFATYLLPVMTAATEIDIISKNCPDDVKECKRRVYTVYLQQGACNWQRVVEALEKSNHQHIAQTIRTTFSVQLN